MMCYLHKVTTTYCIVVLILLITFCQGFTLQQQRRQYSSSSAFHIHQAKDNKHYGEIQHHCHRRQQPQQISLHALNIDQEQQQQSTSFDSDDNNNNDIWELLGIEEGRLALGVKPEEVYKYIGSREDLITKTLTDIPTLTRDMAEKEVDQFLMDYEMLNIYIKYGKEVEKNPDFAVPDTDKEENTGLFAPRNLVFAYLGYVLVTSVPQIIRRIIAEQEVAGVWTPTNIQFIDDWIEKTSPEATARVLQKAAEKAAKLAEATTTSSTVAEISTTTMQDVVSSATSDITDAVVTSATAASSISPDIIPSEALQSMIDTVSSVAIP